MGSPKPDTAGRPRVLTPEIIEEFVTRLVEGQSVAEICRDPRMPARSTIYLTLQNDAAFRKRYELAKAAQVEQLADEILQIADDATNDFVERQGNDGQATLAVDHDHIARSKLRIDSRKWLLSKLAPKKYGERVAAELSGPDGAPMQIEAPSNFEIARRLAFIFARGAAEKEQDDAARSDR